MVIRKQAFYFINLQKSDRLNFSGVYCNAISKNIYNTLNGIIIIYCINPFRRLVLKLLDVAEEYILNGKQVTDGEVLQDLVTAKNYICAFSAYVSQVIFDYLFKDYHAAIANASLASNYAESALNQVVTAIHNFYYSLSLLAIAHNLSDAAQRKQILYKVAANQEIMQKLFSLRNINSQNT